MEGATTQDDDSNFTTVTMETGEQMKKKTSLRTVTALFGFLGNKEIINM